MSGAKAPPEAGFRITVERRVATLTLDRPPVNVLDIKTCRALDDALRGLSALDDVGVLVVAAKGKAFCAGVDVGEHRAATVAEMLRAFHAVCRALLNFPRPTLARVQGAALGGGCELVLCCDVAVAAESASLGLPEIGLGVLPPMAAVLLPPIVGPRAAAEALLWGETLPAARALHMGLVSEVVTDKTLDERIAARARRATELSAVTLRLARKALRLGARGLPEEALQAVEELYLTELMRTEDAAEGLNAFLEKRPPSWRHR